MLIPQASTISKNFILIDSILGLCDSIELDKSEGEVVLLFKADALDGTKLSKVFAEIVLSSLYQLTLTSSLRLEI
jgi:hypothetical protein